MRTKWEDNIKMGDGRWNSHRCVYSGGFIVDGVEPSRSVTVVLDV